MKRIILVTHRRHDIMLTGTGKKTERLQKIDSLGNEKTTY